MLIRLLGETLRRRPRRAGAALLAVALAAALSTSLLGVSLDITERMARELRSYGANILVSPEASELQLEVGGITISPPSAAAGIDESELVGLKTIFWRHNIIGFAPFASAVVQVGAGGERAVLTGTWFDQALTIPKGARVRAEFDQEDVTAEASIFRTGVKSISSWWRVEGEWPDDGDARAALLGARVARRLGLDVGQRFNVRLESRERTLEVVGLLATGGDEEEQIFVPLAAAQDLMGRDSGVDKVLVSALVEPEAKLRSDLRGLDPAEMTPEQYETWYCSPVMSAVVTQIEETLPGVRARPIRQVAESEGVFLSKVGLLMALLTVTALGAAVLAVMTAMTAAVLERRGEIGLMKSIGADGGQVALIFLAEAGFIGLAGGMLGYLAGAALADLIGTEVFGTAVSLPTVVLPVTVVLALVVALAGSALPVHRAMRVDPIILLEGR